MWYVLEGFQEHLAALAREKFNVIIMDIQQPDILSGLAFPAEESEKILAKIGLTGSFDQVPTDMEGVTLLRFNRRQQTERSAAEPTVRINGWAGSDSLRSYFKNATTQILLPVIKKNIEIQVPRGARTPQEAEGIFRILIDSTPSREGTRIIKVPDYVFGFGIRSDQPGSFAPDDPTDNSFTIIDEETGYAPAQIVGNNLYILYHICCFGQGSELEIFQEILRQTAAWFRLSPEERLSQQQKLAEKMAQGQIRIAQWGPEDSIKRAYSRVAGRVLLPAIKKDAVFHASNCRKYELINDGRFHIFFHATVAGNEQSMVQPPERLFGIEVNCQSQSPQPAQTDGNSIVIRDEPSGYAVAELIGDNLFIHHHICCAGSPNETKIFRRLLEIVVEELSVSPEERAARQERLRQRLLEARQREAAEEDLELAKLAEVTKKSRPLYIKACAGRLPKVIKETAKIIRDANNRLSGLGGELIEMIRANQHAETTLRLLNHRLKEEQRLSEEEFDKLLALPGVIGVLMDRNCFMIYTEAIRIEREGTAYLIGQFRIDIRADAERLDILFLNLTNGGRGPGLDPPEGFDADPNLNRHHPYVNQEGRAKLGQLELEIPQFLGKNSYAAVAMLALQFLRIVKEDYAGRGLKWWPVAEAAVPVAAPAKRKRGHAKQLDLPV